MIMERGKITISSNSIAITGDVWMADYKIADLFGVTLSAVNSNIKSIYKSGVLKEYDTYRYLLLENGNRADTFSLDLITSLAFRLNSLPAKTFRDWLCRKVNISNNKLLIVIPQSNKRIHN